jgi:hypothetical protein
MEDTVMDQATADSKSPYSPLWWWPSLWGGQGWNSPGVALAPQSLSQPIQPGWTFGNVIVTENNSGSPDTERDIVAQESYGRQLGRVTDAVAALIEERPKQLPRPKALDDLLALRDKIEKIKSRSAASRLDRIESDLARLKAERPEDYRRIASAMAHEVATMQS